MSHQHATLEDTVYFWFAANDTSGSGGDGTTPLFDVRLAGAAASASPVLSGSPILLTHVDFPAGAHEAAVAATNANGFAANATYGVFCTVLVDSQNPTGFVGSFTLTPLATAAQVTAVHATTDALLSSLSAGASGFSINATGVTVTTGTETNAYTDTFSSGVIHVLTAAGGITLFEYDFDLSQFIGTATEFIWDGYIQANGDSVDVQYYDWVTEGYLTLMTLSGANGTAITEHPFDVPIGATGTGANFGLVKLRFSSTSTTNIGTDRVRCVFNVAPGGINNGTTITLDSTQTNKVYDGENWTLVLAGQDISGSFFHGANVSGISSASSLVTFEDCRFNACTLPPGTYRRCGFGLSDGLFTAASAGEYVFVDCYSLVEGAGTPDFTFVGNGPSTGINNRGWKGGASLTLDADCTISHEVLVGGTQTITTGGAAVELRGTFRAANIVLGTATSETVQIVGTTGPVTITGSPTAATVNVYGVTSSVTASLAGTTINDLSVSRADIELILGDTGELQTDWADGGRLDLILDDVPTTSEFQARTLVAASYFDPTGDAVANVTLVATTTTNTDMVGTNGANTTVPDAAGTAASLHSTTDTLITNRTLLAASYFDPAVDAVANVTLVATTTTNTDMVGTDGANTTVPDAAGTAASLHSTTDTLITNRTLLAAAYFDPAVDAVANVTLVATTTTNTDMVGTDGANTTVPDAAGVVPTAIENADALLTRDVSNVEATEVVHSLYTIILATLESSISGTTWTIKQTDGSTTHQTKTVTVDAGADPITGVT